VPFFHHELVKQVGFNERQRGTRGGQYNAGHSISTVYPNPGPRGKGVRALGVVLPPRARQACGQRAEASVCPPLKGVRAEDVVSVPSLHHELVKQVGTSTGLILSIPSSNTARSLSTPLLTLLTPAPRVTSTTTLPRHCTPRWAPPAAATRSSRCSRAAQRRGRSRRRRCVRVRVCACFTAGAAPLLTNEQAASFGLGGGWVVGAPFAPRPLGIMPDPNTDTKAYGRRLLARALP
jgi:hypothetical protein